MHTYYAFKRTLWVLGICIFVFFNPRFVISGSWAYLSPGVRIGWEIGEGFTMSSKISLGIHFDSWPSSYCNVTFGFKKPFFRKNGQPYHFVEFQAGYMPFRGHDLFMGGGTGFMFYQENQKTCIRPMATVDFGFLIFTAFDFVLLENKKLSTDIGILGVLPIPLNRDIGLE